MVEALQAALFSGDGQNAYAVVDGAACEELLDKLDEFQPEQVCLFAGELEPDLEEVAPYLVKLVRDDPFTAWLLEHCLGKHWAIFACSPADIRALRRHFRNFLLCKSPEGKTLYFRYYDPRILSIYLPMTNWAEARTFFGEISSFFCETEEAFNVYQNEAGKIVQRNIFRFGEEA